MKVYLAARYGRRLELLEYARQLEQRGIAVTSQLLSEDSPSEAEAFCRCGPLRWALQGLEDVTAADTLILFSEPPAEPVAGAERGGRHVEFGIALALGMRCVVVGPRENVFHHLDAAGSLLPSVEVYATWEEARHVLIGGAERTNTEVVSDGHENR